MLQERLASLTILPFDPDQGFWNLMPFDLRRASLSGQARLSRFTLGDGPPYNEGFSQLCFCVRGWQARRTAYKLDQLPNRGEIFSCAPFVSAVDKSLQPIKVPTHGSAKIFGHFGTDDCRVESMLLQP
jgi:hypothetical protein